MGTLFFFLQLKDSHGYDRCTGPCPPMPRILWAEFCKGTQGWGMMGWAQYFKKININTLLEKSVLKFELFSVYFHIFFSCPSFLRCLECFRLTLSQKFLSEKRLDPPILWSGTPSPLLVAKQWSACGPHAVASAVASAVAANT